MVKPRTGTAVMTEFMHVHVHYLTDKDTSFHIESDEIHLVLLLDACFA